MQEINPERQESPGSGEGDELIKTDNDEVSPLVFNPLPALTHQSALDLNAPCRPKRTETHWLSSS